MATNKVHKALGSYTDQIQRIVSCVSDEVFYVYPKNNGRHALISNSSEYFRVKCQDNSYLNIDINQEVEDPAADNGYKVSTKYYLYSIADGAGEDLVGFHYHPELNEDPVLYPHVHAYANKDERFLKINLHKKHIPSGRVPLEDVIHWMIDELEVVPARDDWETVLSEAREQFKSIQTWW